MQTKQAAVQPSELLYYVINAWSHIAMAVRSRPLSLLQPVFISVSNCPQKPAALGHELPCLQPVLKVCL